MELYDDVCGDFFEDLAKRWPEVMQKSEINAVYCRRGWYNLIDGFLSHISTDVEQTKLSLEMARNDVRYHHLIKLYEGRLEDNIKDLPVITTIKEKFGKLRIRVKDNNDEMFAYTSFLETLSTNVCEICGAHGELRLYPSNALQMTYCEEHHQYAVKHFTHIIPK